MRLSLEQADNFVSKNPTANWVVWGKEFTIHRPRAGSEYKPYGRFNRRTSKFGTLTHITVNDNGVFEVPRIR